MQPRFAELCARTHYSFLTGASHPREMIDAASALGLEALAITDKNGVYGIPKAYLARKQRIDQGLPVTKLITGAELTLAGQPPLRLLARDRAAYGLLCRILTASHADKPKGEAALGWSELEELMRRPGASGLVGIADLPEPERPAPDYGRLAELFDASGGRDRLLLPLLRARDGWDEWRTRHAHAASARHGLRVVAVNDAHYHDGARSRLQDVMTCIREGVALDAAGTRLFQNAERRLKSPREMAELFRDLPDALRATVDVAESFTFSPGELTYQYPSEWIPAGETAQAYLTRLAWAGARERWPDGTPPDLGSRIRAELALIQAKGYADYFLTIWEIVKFARDQDILCQGRGSAANSVVCYCLGITAVNPREINLLFERFVSMERDEPPDIDVDFEHERREEVIQHIYAKYGRDRAAMVAAVITYQDKLVAREVSKAFGREMDARALDAAVAAGDPLAAQAHRHAEELSGFPRHLSIHSGGFTLSQGPIIETVPVEPARMGGRTIVQWDKNDLDALGLLKVDVLSLGMLSALRKAMKLVGIDTLHDIPRDDLPTYDMICEADTVGVFQIESRAQMSMLPRLKPRVFYDLVVQVAIVRPGPIVGGMVHPYLRRRRGDEPVEYPHPALDKILCKTYGVPLFQEQVMQMAISLAGFSGGEADQLRRAIAAWRSDGSMDEMGARLRAGLLKSGLPPEYVERIFKQIEGFAEYGFPESHSASFALLAYASSFLKRHHPAEFACALINSQPMGFYPNHTLIDDARRHGVEVRGVDPRASEWDCTIEPAAGGKPALRVGLRATRGMSEAEGRAIVAARPYAGLADLMARARVRPRILHALAMGDAFACFGLDQRAALWEILAHQALLQPSVGEQGSLFGASFADAAVQPGRAGDAFDFRPLSSHQAIQADYDAYGLSSRGHPMQALRARIAGLPRHDAKSLRALASGSRARVAGLVIVRQKPPTAKGTTFATLEDETGFVDLILHKSIDEKYGVLFRTHVLLVAEGLMQRDGDAVSMLVKRLEPVLLGGGPEAAEDRVWDQLETSCRSFR